MKDGKRSEEHCALIASPISSGCTGGAAESFAGNETNELGEELDGSYLHQVHLYDELESDTYDRSCQPAMHIRRSSGWFIAWIGQTSNLYGIFVCQVAPTRQWVLLAGP